jgi:hypothetical protein
MRSNQNPSGSVARGVGDRNAVARSVVTGSVVNKLSMPPLPFEWLDAGSWRLPSGKALAEFALQAGFLAPLLFRAEGWGKNAREGSSRTNGATASTEQMAQAPGKQFGKGEGR